MGLISKTKDTADRCVAIYHILEKTYGNISCPLNFNTPFQLMVCAMLSAQCTDKRVNKIAPLLFEKYPTSSAMAKAKLEDVERIITPLGLFRSKSKNIVNVSKKIEKDFLGKLPSTIEELITLPGIGRKTANVIIAHVFNGPGFAVDTHVNRLLNRMGIVRTSDPVKIEFLIRAMIPSSHLGNFSLLLITHGRRICKARTPQCGKCCVNELCVFFQKFINCV